MKKAFLGLMCLALLMFAPSLMADSVLTTVAVGPEPTGVAVNPATNKIYVAVDALGQVAVINGETQQVTTHIDVGRNAIAVAVNLFTNRIYASGCDQTACNVAVIDGNTDTLITQIPIASGSFIGIQGLAANPVTNRVYVSDADHGRIIVIDGKTNTIITQFQVPAQPAGIAVNPKTNRIYIGNGGFPADVLVYDGNTNTQVAIIPQNFGGGSQVATNFRLNRAYSTVASTELSVIDGDTNQQIAQLPDGPFAFGVDVNLLNNKIYVANANGGSVTIVDGNTDEVIQTLPVPATFPNGVGVNPVSGLVYVSDFHSDKVVVLQPDKPAQE